MPLSPLVFLAPLWLLLELAQLVIGERFLGIKQIERGEDPRTRGPGEFVSFLWSAGIIVYWTWMSLMLTQSVGRPQVLAMLGVSFAGFAIRRICTLKWVLVVLTFEGAIRIGMLISLSGLIWRRL